MEATWPHERFSNSIVSPPNGTTANKTTPALRRPERNEIVQLFKEFKRIRADFVFYPGLVHRIFKTQLKWKVKRHYIKGIWTTIIAQGPLVTTTPDGSQIEWNNINEYSESQKDVIASIISICDDRTATIHQSTIDNDIMADRTSTADIGSSCPSAMEIMNFLWTLDEDYPQCSQSRRFQSCLSY
jgi:hypothetical protein